MLTKEFIEKMEIKLKEEKKEVEEKINKYSLASEPDDNPDLDDIAQKATEGILDESLTAVHKEVLEKINRALEKITLGTYGICEACGVEISEEDLIKEPWAEHCGKCKN
ncbi:MAG: TraR/DksA family transcriptional regulator [Patescibacteria group bacterium]